jgi:hypothetical protein
MHAFAIEVITVCITAGADNGRYEVQRNFCDGCEAELVEYRAVLSLIVAHSTNRRGVVGYDEYNSIELCRGCVNVPQVLMKLFRQLNRTSDSIERDQPAQTIDTTISL